MGEVGGGALCVSKVLHAPKRESPAIRDGLWGPPFLCAGGLLVSSVVDFVAVVPLINPWLLR